MAAETEARKSGSSHSLLGTYFGPGAENSDADRTDVWWGSGLSLFCNPCDHRRTQRGLLREGELYRLCPSLDVGEALARATSKT